MGGVFAWLKILCLSCYSQQNFCLVSLVLGHCQTSLHPELITLLLKLKIFLFQFFVSSEFVAVILETYKGERNVIWHI